jgi:hypothetical protein
MTVYHHCFSTLLLNNALGRSKKNKKKLDFNGTHQLWSALMMLIHCIQINTVDKNTAAGVQRLILK